MDKLIKRKNDRNMMENLLTKKELQVKLKVSLGKIDMMIKNDEIPYYRLKRLIRFDWDEIIKTLR